MKKLIFTLALVFSFGLANANNNEVTKVKSDMPWVTKVKKVIRQTNADGTVTMLIIYHTVWVP